MAAFLSVNHKSEAIPLLRKMYPSLVTTDELLENWLHQSRILHQAYLCLSLAAKRKTTGSRGVLQTYAELHKYIGLESEKLHGRGCVLTSAELSDLISHIRRAVKLPLFDVSRQGYVVWPVMVDTHLLAGFYFHPPSNPDPIYVSLRDDYQVGFIGLMDSKFPTLTSMIPGIMGFKESSDIAVVPILLQGDIPPVIAGDLMLETVPGNPADMKFWTALAKILDTGKDIQISTAEKKVATVRTRLVDVILQKLKTGMDIKSLLETLRPGKSVLKILHRKLVGLNMEKEALLVSSSYANTTRHEAANGNVFVASIQGYRMAAKKTPFAFVDISNFTLTVTEIVHCPQSLKNMLGVTFKFLGTSKSTIIPDRFLEKPRELERIAQNIFVDASISGGQNPAIFEPTSFKQMSAWFQQQKSNAVYCVGVENLGWTPDNLEFSAPSWTVDFEGFSDSRSRKAHPDVSILKFFDFDRKIELGELGKPGVLGHLLSMCVALVARAYTGLPCRGIPVLQTDTSMVLLARLFRALGQSSPVHVSAQTRHDHHKVMRGFPFYGIGTDSVSAKSIKNSVFILTDAGISLQEPDDWETPLRSLPKLLEETAGWILETSGSSISRVKAATYESELVQEGEKIIRDELGYRNWPVTAELYTSLERFLSGIPAQDIRKWFRHDLMEQLVYIKKPDVSITADLKALSTAFKETKTSYIIDALSASQLVEHYYDKAPAMDVVALEA